MEIHSCSLYCDRPDCVKAQRDELRDRCAHRLHIEVTLEDDDEPIPIDVYCSEVMLKRLQAHQRGRMREIAELRKRIAELEAAMTSAYGHLWCINCEPGTPVRMYDPEAAAYAVRKVLRDLLTTEQRGNGINAARAAIDAARKE